MRRRPPGSHLTDNRFPYTTVFRSAGSDRVVFNAGESRPTLGGSGNDGTIAGHDVITDFDLATDLLNLPGTPVPDGNGPVNGTNSDLTINNAPIRSHSVTDGLISFDDNNSFGTALALSSEDRKSTRLNSSHYCAYR